MLAAFPALGASEYEQGFDFSLSSPQNLNTFLFSSGIPSWPVFNFQPRNVTLLKFVEIPAFFGIFINSLPLRLDKGNAMTQQAQIRKSIWVWCGWSAVSCSPINCRFPKKEVLPFSLCWNCISAVPLNSPIIWTNRAELTLLCILSPQQCDYNFCKCFFYNKHICRMQCQWKVTTVLCFSHLLDNCNFWKTNGFKIWNLNRNFETKANWMGSSHEVNWHGSRPFYPFSRDNVNTKRWRGL